MTKSIDSVQRSVSRRQILLAAANAAAFSGLILPNCSADAFNIGKPLQAGENLMQEHAVLGRTILIYEDIANRFEHGQKDPQDCLMKATDIIIKHIQGQHERIEELIIFPTLTRAHALPELISILVAQHKAGRNLTESISKGLAAGSHKTNGGRLELAHLARMFSRMFRPHALREDSVVYPQLHKILNEHEYVDLSARIQSLEDKMVNNADLETILRQLDDMEIACGIHDLAKYTSSS